MINDDILPKVLIYSVFLLYFVRICRFRYFGISGILSSPDVGALLYVYVFVRYMAFIHVLTNDDSSCIRSNIIENTFSSNQLSLVNCHTQTDSCLQNNSHEIDFRFTALNSFFLLDGSLCLSTSTSPSIAWRPTSSALFDALLFECVRTMALTGESEKLIGI